MYTAAVLSHILKKRQIVQEFLTSKLQPHYLGKYKKFWPKKKIDCLEQKKMNMLNIIMAPIFPKNLGKHISEFNLL